MAAISKSGTPSLSSATPPHSSSLSGLLAGEAIAAGDACYIKTSDGKLWRSNGTNNDAAAVVDGFAATSAAVGDALTLYWGVNFAYGAALSPGSFCYLDTAPGGLSTVATTGGLVPIARVLDATRIWVRKSY